MRQALVRWEEHVSDHLRWAVAVEDPNPQIENASGADGEARATVPDVVGRLRYENERGRLHIAGIVRQLRFDTGAATGLVRGGVGRQSHRTRQCLGEGHVVRPDSRSVEASRAT